MPALEWCTCTGHTCNDSQQHDRGSRVGNVQDTADHSVTDQQLFATCEWRGYQAGLHTYRAGHEVKVSSMTEGAGPSARLLSIVLQLAPSFPALGVTWPLSRAGARVQDMLSREEQEQGRVEVLPVQWRKHLTLEVRSAPSHRCAAAAKAAAAAVVAVVVAAAAIAAAAAAAAAAVSAAVFAAAAVAAAAVAAATITAAVASSLKLSRH